MFSLSQLNNRGQTTLPYTDNRAAQVIFNRTVPINQTISVYQGSTLPVAPGIEIVEIVQPNVVNVYYEIDVSSVAGATVSWTGVPGTVSISNPSAGVYRASNIDTASDWTAVRAPTINLPGGFTDEFSYTATIYYEPNKSKVTTNGVVFKTVLSAIFNIVQVKLTGLQTSIINAASVFTQTTAVTRVQKFIVNLNSQASIISNAAKRVKTSVVLSSVATLNSILGIRKQFALAVTSINTLYCDVKVFYLHKGQAALNAISSLVTTGKLTRDLIPTTLPVLTSVDSVNPNNILVSTSNVIDQNYNIIGGFDGLSTYIGGVRYFGGSRENSTIIRKYTGTIPSIEATLTADDNELIYDFVTGNSDMSSIAFVAAQFNQNYYSLYMYDRSGTTWTRTNKFTNLNFIIRLDYGLSMSKDGNYVALAIVDSYSSGSGTGRILVYEKSLGVWSLLSTINLNYSGGNLAGLNGAVRISNSGSYVTIRNAGDGIRVYAKSGSSYSLQQTISVTSASSYTGLEITSDGQYIIAGRSHVEDLNVVPINYGTTATLTQNVTTISNGITVNNISAFPTSGYLMIDGEIFEYLSKNGITNTLEGITHGAGYLPATTHSIGATVYLVSNYWIDRQVQRGNLVVYKRTGSTWALEQTLYAEGDANYDYIGNFGTAVYCDGTITNIQTDANKFTKDGQTLVGSNLTKWTRI